MTSWPVSRVLYGSGLSAGTWQPFIWDGACATPRATHPDDWPGNRLEPCGPASSLFGLAPGGVYRAAPVASGAVGSYPTLSPLPGTSPGGLLSVALSLGSPPPDVIRRRVSVEPGLSSPCGLSTLARRGCPANWWRLCIGSTPANPVQNDAALSESVARNPPHGPARKQSHGEGGRRRGGRSRPNSWPPSRSRRPSRRSATNRTSRHRAAR